MSGDQVVKSYDDYFLSGELATYNGSLYTQNEINEHNYVIRWDREFDIVNTNTIYYATDYTAVNSYSDFKALIDAVNDNIIDSPNINITGNVRPDTKLNLTRSIRIDGNGSGAPLVDNEGNARIGANGETTLTGYDATSKDCGAFYVNITEENQTIEINNIVFDHFCYYVNVDTKTKATNSQVKNAVSILTYSGNCPASATLKFTNCTIIGTARDMINASSTTGCKDTLIFENCKFNATDRLQSTLNMLSFFGNQDGELNVEIRNCKFIEASEQNATWATSAIASFGNANIVIENCELIACQVAIAIDNTFDSAFSVTAYPCYKNTTVIKNNNIYDNCLYGYYEESIIDQDNGLYAIYNNDIENPIQNEDDIIMLDIGFDAANDEPAPLYRDKTHRYGNYIEYDLEIPGILNNETGKYNARYEDLICLYIPETSNEE